MDVCTMFSKCQRATGSLPAAALLYRIVYWQGRASIIIDGHRWVAKDRSTWMVETGLSRDQYNRALRKLKDLNIVETRQALFGNRNVTHVRMVEGFELASPPIVESSETATPEFSSSATPGCSAGAKLYIEENITENIPSKEKGVLSHAEAMKPGAKNKTVSEIVKNGKPGNPHKPDTTAYLEHVWKTAVSEKTGKVVIPFTVAQKSQFKRLLKLCPEGKTDEIILYCVENWTEFIKSAEVEAGAYNAPHTPSTWFLVKFIEVAINLWQSQWKNSAPKGKAAPSVQSIAIKKPIDSTKASLDEVMSILQTD